MAYVTELTTSKGLPKKSPHLWARPLGKPFICRLHYLMRRAFFGAGTGWGRLWAGGLAAAILLDGSWVKRKSIKNPIFLWKCSSQYGIMDEEVTTYCDLHKKYNAFPGESDKNRMG